MANDTERQLLETAGSMVEKARQAVHDLERTLALSDYDATEDARARLSEARKFLAYAAGDIERAGADLVPDGPVPDA